MNNGQSREAKLTRKKKIIGKSTKFAEIGEEYASYGLGGICVNGLGGWTDWTPLQL